MQQTAIPVEVSEPEVRRERSLGGAIDLCMKAAGLEPKSVQQDLKLDKAQMSRWISGQEGVVWPKLEALMDCCGNDAPLLWMIHARGYDVSSLRKRETETEKALRVALDRVQELERDKRVLASAISGRLA